MNSIFLSRLLRLILLLLFQVMVFNHIHLFGYITPLVIGYMVVCMHRNTSRTEILIWGFVIGLIFDMFSNTAGMAAGSCTLIAMTPSFHTLGFWNYIFYVLLLMLVLHGLFYLLDAFTLANFLLTLISIIGSTVLSTLIIVIMEFLIRPRKGAMYHM